MKRERAVLAARAIMEAAGTRKIPPQEWTETDVEIAADCIESGLAFPGQVVGTYHFDADGKLLDQEAKLAAQQARAGPEAEG